jgi:hypothetical protein
MKKDLLKIANDPINTEAYNATVLFSRLGFPEFGEDAQITLRPQDYARGATKYLKEGQRALIRLERSLHALPSKEGPVALDPASFANDGEEERIRAAHALECGYASLVVAGWESVEILVDPATDVDIEAAAAGSYVRYVTKLESGEDGPKLVGEPFEEEGYDLEEGSIYLPFAPKKGTGTAVASRNIWKLFHLRPRLATAIYHFTIDDANFPEMMDPLASRKNGAGGARSTSKTETPQKGASGHPKRAGRLRSSRTN